ncbi:hypothetical protein JNB71_01690 [Rhizobium herbae]|uniref:Uncharacterized protein n=1 Tax=Rhizobium herbae TaxID=508661 RepID=A0ABS7H462_9HYPH|nr:hypothetical protein [Rhizobium herbae]MBW9062017.1 hypothetical protein [Rhizobium herbae]
MRRFFVSAVVASMFFCQFGLQNTAKADGVRDQCDAAAFFAHAVMMGRQSGMSIKEAQTLANNMLTKYKAPPAARTYYRSIVSEVFRHPRYQEKDMQSRAMNEFQDFVFTDCMKLLSR